MTEMSQPTSWRTVDIVVAAVIAVAFGVVFWAWGVATAPLFQGQVNPLAYLVSGVWLIPGVLAMLVIRIPLRTNTSKTDAMSSHAASHESTQTHQKRLEPQNGPGVRPASGRRPPFFGLLQTWKRRHIASTLLGKSAARAAFERPLG